jgi:outer membrane protein assembly factor BamB
MIAGTVPAMSNTGGYRRVGWMLSALLAAASPAAAWRQELADGLAKSIALHPSGDVIAAGNFVSGAVTDLAVARLAAGSGAQVWSIQLDGDLAFHYDEALRVAVDGNGDVIAAGTLAAAGDGFAVVKVDGANGMELWRASGTGVARAVAIDASGNPVAVGSTDADLVVRKFAAATGALVWEHTVSGTEPGDGHPEGAYDVVIDALGNPIAVGILENVDDTDLIVLKLAAADGAEIWRREIDGDDGPDGDAGRAVALDGAGDVIAAGTLGLPGFAVLKLAGATGSEIWRQTSAFAGGGFAYDMALDAAGDAVAVGFVFRPGAGAGDSKLAALKVDGDTGTVLWSHEIGGGGLSEAQGVAVDAAGDVAVAGALTAVRTARDFVVVKFAGGTGAELWRQTITRDHYSPFDLAAAVTFGASGHVFAGGTLEVGVDRNFAVVRLGGSDGAVGPVAGAKLVVRDRLGEPAARRILGILRDRSIGVALGGGVGDPTLSGAVLRLVNEGTLEADTLSLPSTGWVALGAPPGSRGYQYVDSTGAGGACRRVRVKRGLIKVNCLGSQGPIAFSLDEPTQGALTLSLQLGGAETQCTKFGGDVRSDSGTSNPGPSGTFDGRDAPAVPGTCP